MKYHRFYFNIFKQPIIKVLLENYGNDYAREIITKSKIVYKKLIEEADDIGDDNPMAYNEMFAFVFVAPYIASEKSIPPEIVQEMMRRALYSLRWFFSLTNLNTKMGKKTNKKIILKYYKWYTEEKEELYPTSFKVDFEGEPYEGACYYRITRCPICAYTKKIGVAEFNAFIL